MNQLSESVPNKMKIKYKIITITIITNIIFVRFIVMNNIIFEMKH